MSNKYDDMTDTQAAIYYNKFEKRIPPRPDDDVVCTVCGESIKARDAAIRYTGDPSSMMMLPPERRKYWCKTCFGRGAL